jgi:hypothetical protein
VSTPLPELRSRVSGIELSDPVSAAALASGTGRTTSLDADPVE